jgi:hypothetical protein
MDLAQRLADARDQGWIQWIQSDADERAVSEGCWFDLKAAERVQTFFRQFLRHSKGQWAPKPFELLDWQWRRVIAPLFGWKRADGTRRAFSFSARRSRQSRRRKSKYAVLAITHHVPNTSVPNRRSNRPAIIQPTPATRNANAINGPRPVPALRSGVDSGD